MTKARILLDSDVIINHLRQKKVLSSKLSSAILFISVISWGELLRGIQRSSRKQEAKKKLEKFITDFNIKILLLSETELEIYAEDDYLLQKNGKKIDNFDLLIAATAKAHDLELLTYNHKHFDRIPDLKLV